MQIKGKILNFVHPDKTGIFFFFIVLSCGLLKKKEEKALTFDAVRAKRNFIFKFDIFDNGGERQPSQLSSTHKT